MKTIIFSACLLATHAWPGTHASVAAASPSINIPGTPYAPKIERIQNAGSKQHTANPGYFKDSVAGRFTARKLQGQKAYPQFKKLDPQAYALFRQSILADGFLESKEATKEYTGLFQKKNTTITVTKSGPEEAALYEIAIEKKVLPRLKELRFAEDLLLFNAHQHLIAVFGAQNVAEDIFYNTDGAAVACSVIFPGSSREAVFLWQDTRNLRQLAAVRIGGNKHTASAIRTNNIAPQSQWLSRQGLYATMTLNQLQHRNGNPLLFYGWGAGAQGRLYNTNKGNLDFRALDLQFGCLNCNDDAYYGPQQLASDKAIADGRRIFIATMIFYPPAACNE